MNVKYDPFVAEQFAQRIKPYRDDPEKMNELKLFFESMEEHPSKTASPIPKRNIFKRLFKK